MAPRGAWVRPKHRPAPPQQPSTPTLLPLLEFFSGRPSPAAADRSKIIKHQLQIQAALSDENLAKKGKNSGGGGGGGNQKNKKPPKKQLAITAGHEDDYDENDDEDGHPHHHNQTKHHKHHRHPYDIEVEEEIHDLVDEDDFDPRHLNHHSHHQQRRIPSHHRTRETPEIEHRAYLPATTPSHAAVRNAVTAARRTTARLRAGESRAVAAGSHVSRQNFVTGGGIGSARAAARRWESATTPLQI